MGDRLRADIQPAIYVFSSLRPSGLTKSNTSFAGVKAGMSPVPACAVEITLCRTVCDFVWHASACSGEASCGNLRFTLPVQVLSTCFYLAVLCVADLLVLYTRCGNSWLQNSVIGYSVSWHTTLRGTLVAVGRICACDNLEAVLHGHLACRPTGTSGTASVGT